MHECLEATAWAEAVSLSRPQGMQRCVGWAVLPNNLPVLAGIASPLRLGVRRK
jgi:hypothetical protein